MDITLTDCDSQSGVQSVTVSPVGLSDKLRIVIDPLCECDCSSSSSAIATSTCGSAPECNGRGSPTCGVCQCCDGFSGPFCECESASANEATLAGFDPYSGCRMVRTYTNKANVTRKLLGQVCEGHGTCVCGKCACDIEATAGVIIRSYSGKYCQNVSTEHVQYKFFGNFKKKGSATIQ